MTCLYAGRGDAGVWSRISALAMSHTGLPNMVMALATSIAQPCMGSTIAMRRETLEAIGGFARFADVLADDYAIGEAVAASGTECRRAADPAHPRLRASQPLPKLWRQHLRWSATIRGVAPMRHLGSGIYPCGWRFAVLAAPFVPLAGGDCRGPGLGALADRRARSAALPAFGRGSAWLLPMADMLEFAAFIASLCDQRRSIGAATGLQLAQKGRIAARNPSLTERPMKKTIFLQAPSFDGYDGGAGARYQMKREVKSFWYPTWLAQPAAMVQGFKADRRARARSELGRYRPRI